MVALLLAFPARAYEVANDYFAYPVELDVPAEDGEEGIVTYAGHSISGQYGVGTSQISIFEGLVSKLPYGVHYVYWRDGQYNYRLAYGEELELTGTMFRADAVSLVTYNSYSSSGTQATYTSSSESNFSLSAGSYMVWSDLGHYPDLYTGRGARDYAHAACFGVAVIVILGCLDVLRRSCRL